MKDESDPVSADEYVYRRIPIAFCDLSLPEPIQYVAFRPRDDDTDGISLYREAFVTAEQAGVGPNPKGYYVSRLKVADILALKDKLKLDDLTVCPTKGQGDLSGHVSIPQLTPGTKNQAKMKELMLELAKLAGKDIIRHPRGG